MSKIVSCIWMYKNVNLIGDNMKTKEEIINILTDALCYAYCDNCGNGMDEDLCGDCHRKYQNWKLSRDAAEKIADEILK